MDFNEFFQLVGDHLPALGAFLCTLLVVSLLCLIFYKLGKHAEAKRWEYDVRMMPAVIGQDIREKLERDIAKRDATIEFQRERLNELTPVAGGAVQLLSHFIQEGGELKKKP